MTLRIRESCMGLPLSVPCGSVRSSQLFDQMSMNQRFEGLVGSFAPAVVRLNKNLTVVVRSKSVCRPIGASGFVHTSRSPLEVWSWLFQMRMGRFVWMTTRTQSPSDEGQFPDTSSKIEAFAMHWSLHYVSDSPARRRETQAFSRFK